MSQCYVLYLNSDNYLLVSGLVNPLTGLYINDAVLSVEMRDSSGALLNGVTWPLTLGYVAGSHGDYSVNLPNTLEANSGDSGSLHISAQSGTLESSWATTYVFARRGSADYLTSRREIEDMFGIENTERWADLENEGSQATISRRFQWAVEEATAEAEQLLLGSPAYGACSNDRMLRVATTRLAGVMLYESRGVKDAADEEGRHRLKWHRDRARLYFQQVQAGQVRVSKKGGTPASVPASVKTNPRVHKDKFCRG